MLGSGWHRLPCGAAVLMDEDGQPIQVCDLGTVTLDIDEGIFAGDANFLDMLADDLRDLGWEVVLGLWVPSSYDLRAALSLELSNDDLAERAAHVADVLGAEAATPSTPPRRPVRGMPGVEVDRCGAFVVRRGSDGRAHELPLHDSTGILEVELDGDRWCVDELVRRAWEGGPEPDVEPVPAWGDEPTPGWGDDPASRWGDDPAPGRDSEPEPAGDERRPWP